MAIHQSLAIIFNRLVMKVKIKNIYSLLSPKIDIKTQEVVVRYEAPLLLGVEGNISNLL